MHATKPYPRTLRILVTLVIAAALPSNAATVKPVSVDEMLVQSQLVIDGTVVEIVTEKSPLTNAINTVVTFQVNEVIKGSVQDSTVEVRFLGGIAGGAGMQIPGLIYPEYGERGVYFLEDPGRDQVNPIYGWDQGHFIVDDPGAGEDAGIYTVGFNQVFGLAAGAAAPGQRFSNNTAAGVLVTPANETSPPLTIGGFKDALRLILADIDARKTDNQTK